MGSKVTKFCGQCGSPLAKKAKFCGGCGTATGNASEELDEPRDANDSPPASTSRPGAAASAEQHEGPPPASPAAMSGDADGVDFIAVSLEKAKALPAGALICGVAGLILLISLLTKYVGPQGVVGAFTGSDEALSKSLFSSSPVVGVLAVLSFLSALAMPIVYSRAAEQRPGRIWVLPSIAGIATAFGLVIVALRPPGGGLESYVTGPMGGLYVGLLASFGVAMGALMLPGAPFGAAAAQSADQSSFADSLRHVRQTGNNLALTSLILACVGPLAILLGALVQSTALFWLGLAAAIAAVITAGIAKAKAKRLGDELASAFARKSQWLGWGTLIALVLLMIAVIVVLAQAADDFGIDNYPGSYGD